MECTGKLDETSSLFSNSSGTILDRVRLPKPPPSLGRRKQREIISQTPPEVFEFSDSFPETTSFNSNAKLNMLLTKHIIAENCNSNYVSEADDRYEALRNLDINDNDSVFVSKPQPIIPHNNNPFLSTPFLKPCDNGHPDSEKSNETFFKKDVRKNDEAVFVQSHERGGGQNRDKYAAISEAFHASPQNGGEESEGMKWSRSVMGYGQFGWSDQVLHGESY